MIRKFEGLTANDLIEILANYPRDTKICIEYLGICFPIKQVEQCIYYDFEKGSVLQERSELWHSHSFHRCIAALFNGVYLHAN